MRHNSQPGACDGDYYCDGTATPQLRNMPDRPFMSHAYSVTTLDPVDVSTIPAIANDA